MSGEPVKWIIRMNGVFKYNDGMENWNKVGKWMEEELFQYLKDQPLKISKDNYYKLYNFKKRR